MTYFVFAAVIGLGCLILLLAMPRIVGNLVTVAVVSLAQLLGRALVSGPFGFFATLGTLYIFWIFGSAFVVAAFQHLVK